MRLLLATMISILSCCSVAAQDIGLVCFQKGYDDYAVIAFHETVDGHVVIMEGDFENPLPATWNGQGEVIASIEGEDTLSVLDGDYNLHIVSKVEGLITGTRCLDITKAAKTLNNDYGQMTALTNRIGELEDELKFTQEEAKATQEQLQEQLEEFENLPTATLIELNAELAELNAEIEDLKAHNERLAKNSRMWQGVIARLRAQLQEK